MNDQQDRDLRYFIEIDLDSLEIVRVGSDAKQVLDGGKQMQPGIHRLFLSKGQYTKFVDRCAPELRHVLDS